MPILPFMLLLFIGIPLLEIYFLIEVGDVIGAFPTVLAVVFTAVLGVGLIRIQGFSTLQKAQNSMNQGKLPAIEMFEGVMLLFAAICLLIPGFFTDSIGFILLIPPLRTLLATKLIGTSVLRSGFSHFHAGNSQSYYEGEYEDLTPEQQHQKNQDRLQKTYIIEGKVEPENNKKED